MNATPQFALSSMPEAATDFIQGIERPSQLDAWCGRAEPFKDDPVVYNAIRSAQEALVNGGSKIKALSGDLTRSEPQRHEAGGEVSAKTVAKMEESGRILAAQANAYKAGADAALKEAFPLKDGDKWVYDHWLSYARQQAVNQEDGYSNIRKAALAHSECATVLIKLPAELTGLSADFVTKLRTKIVEKYHPEILDAYQRADAIREVASRYPSISGRVKLNFHNPLIAMRAKTRVEV